MKVSIIIPVYNVEPYVEECLRSVLRQTYRDLEVIVVDDCGTDGSMAVVSRVLKEELDGVECRVLHHTHNRGLSAARNTGIDASTGDYIYFIDSDDWIRPDTIALLVGMAERWQGIDMVLGGMFSDDERHNSLFLGLQEYFGPDEVITDEARCRSKILCNKLFCMATGRLVRRDFLVQNNIRFEEGIIHEDELWNFFVGKHIRSMAMLKQETYFYRTTPTGIICASTAKRKFDSLCIICSIMLRHLDRTNWKMQSDELIRVLGLIKRVNDMKVHDPLEHITEGNNFVLRMLARRYMAEDWTCFFTKTGRRLRRAYFLLRLLGL